MPADSPVSVTAASESPSRGTERLLGDCARMGRLLACGRLPAQERLEAEVGERLACELVALVRRIQSEND